MSHHFKADVFQTFLPMSHDHENIRNLERYQALSFNNQWCQNTNKEAGRCILSMYCFFYGFENGMLHNRLFCGFHEQVYCFF